MHRAIAAQRRLCQAEPRRAMRLTACLLLLLGTIVLENATPSLALARAAGTQSSFSAAPLEAQRYVMDVTLDPEKFTIAASADVIFGCKADLHALEFSLHRGLRITAVRDAQGHPLSWSRSSQAGSATVFVELEKPCSSGSTVQIHLEYAGTILPAQPFWPAFYYQLLRDDDLWYPVATTFDFAEHEMVLHVPAYSETLTSGNLVEQRREGKFSTYRWKTTFPVNGQTVVVYSRPKRSPAEQQSTLIAGAKEAAIAPQALRVEEICSDEVAAMPKAAPCGELARRAVPILQKYTAMLGPPPGTSLVILPLGVSIESVAGYSAPGILVVSDWEARFAGASAYLPGFLPHEIAHQWFPNGVAPAHSSDGWLAESLAEYLAWRYLLEADPESARAMVAEAMRDAVAETPMRPLSLGLDLLGSANSEGSARATLYQRGMLVFRTLETVIDRERVDRALAEFYRRYAGRKASIADFRVVCEEIAGRDLGWFFQYFIQGTQIPTIELRRVPSESPGVVAGVIVVKDFPVEGSVRVEMAIRTAQGTVEHSVATRGEVTPFSINVPAPVLDITLDPDQRVLRWTETAERSKAQLALLSGLPNPVTRLTIPAAIDLYQRTLAADPEDASLRAQCLRERLGELEFEQQKWDAALADFDAAVNGHSLSLLETYACRAKAYVYRGYLHLHRGQKREALDDASDGLALPDYILLQDIPGVVFERAGGLQLLQSLKIIRQQATTN